MSKARWVIGLVLTVAALHASPTFDFHLTGLDGNGDAVSGDAIFTILDTHHFSVTVTNTSSMQDLEQVIEGLEFTLTADGVVLLTSSGDFVIIDSNGTVRTLLSGATGWGLQASGSGWLVCAQCGATDAADLVGAGPYSSLFSGSYLDSATFDFSTNSALPTDGTDPFSNVWLVFGSGESTGQTSIVGNNNGGTNGGTNNGASDDPPVGATPIPPISISILAASISILAARGPAHRVPLVRRAVETRSRRALSRSTPPCLHLNPRHSFR